MAVLRLGRALGSDAARGSGDRGRVDRIARDDGAADAGGGAAAAGGAWCCRGSISTCRRAVWDGLGDALTAEDHPQFRFRRLFDDAWRAARRRAAAGRHETAPNPARNRLISLSLRPAPVTDQWLAEGPGSADLAEATARMTLIEAPDPRDRGAGHRADPAAGGRGGARGGADHARPDADAAGDGGAGPLGHRAGRQRGRPLALSAPGRLLRQVARAVRAGADGRGPAGAAEASAGRLGQRAGRPPAPGRAIWNCRCGGRARPSRRARQSVGWAAAQKGDGRASAWAAWLAAALDGVAEVGTRPLAAHVAHHLAVAEALAAGPGGRGRRRACGRARPGTAARAAMDELAGRGRAWRDR